MVVRIRRRERQGACMSTRLHKQGEVTARLLKLLRINSPRLLHCSRGQVHAAAQSRDYQARQRTSSAFVRPPALGWEVSGSLIHWHTPNVRVCKSFGRRGERSDGTRQEALSRLSSLPALQLLLWSNKVGVQQSRGSEVTMLSVQYADMRPLDWLEHHSLSCSWRLNTHLIS